MGAEEKDFETLLSEAGIVIPPDFGEVKPDDEDEVREVGIDWALHKGTLLLFHGIDGALAELLKGEKTREAATALFWSSYYFREPDIDEEKALLERKLAEYEGQLSDESKKAGQLILTNLSALVNLRDNLSLKTIMTDENRVTMPYVQVVTGAARIAMTLRKVVKSNNEIEYNPKLVELIGNAFETMRTGIDEAHYFREDEARWDLFEGQIINASVFGFTACVACGIVLAAHAHFLSVKQEAYEDAFLAYADAFKWFSKPKGKFKCFTMFYEDDVLHLPESLYVYDRLVKEPGEVKDWGRIDKAFKEFDEILLRLGMEDDLMSDSGIKEGAPGDWYFPTQIRLNEAQAKQAKNEKWKERVAEDRENAAKERLERYFFEDTWKYLPEEAQGHLIIMDSIWAPSSRNADLPLALNHLQRATEIVLRDLISYMLDSSGELSSKSFKDVGDLLKMKEQLHAKGKQAGLGDIAYDMMSKPVFKHLVDSFQSISQRNRELIMNEATTNTLKALIPPRNAAEYPLPRASQGAGQDSKKVTDLFRKFLGIGRYPGILPCLAAIRKEITVDAGRK